MLTFVMVFSTWTITDRSYRSFLSGDNLTPDEVLKKIREKNLETAKVSRNGRKCFLLFLDTFGSRNKRKSVWKQEKGQKVSKNGRKLFSYFYTLLVLEIREKVYRNRRTNKKYIEMGENFSPIFRHFLLFFLLFKSFFFYF